MGRCEINIFLFYIIAGVNFNKTANMFNHVALTVLSFIVSAWRTFRNKEIHTTKPVTLTKTKKNHPYWKKCLGTKHNKQ